MGNTYHSINLHLIFSCKERRPLITHDIQERLYSYIGGILRKRDCVLLEAGGVSDHVHLLIGMPPRHALSDVMRELKSNSSKWVHETFPDREFGWQDGYGVFSVSISKLKPTREYIQTQEAHHAKTSFQDELRWFVESHGLQYMDDNEVGDGSAN